MLRGHVYFVLQWAQREIQGALGAEADADAVVRVVGPCEERAEPLEPPYGLALNLRLRRRWSHAAQIS